MLRVDSSVAISESGSVELPKPKPTALIEDSAAANRGNWLAKVCRIEWLGQTIASLCWTTSMFVYGIHSFGDILQLSAAGAWLLANIATITASER